MLKRENESILGKITRRISLSRYWNKCKTANMNDPPPSKEHPETLIVNGIFVRSIGPIWCSYPVDHAMKGNPYRMMYVCRFMMGNPR
jgi:hypothetical protein